MRVGIGVDVHQFAIGRRLMLCGVEVPYELGLLGYSDADVALHAVTDAALGAAALGDIGQHFPTGDPRYLDADSAALLREAMNLVAERSLRIGNVDLTIVAQRPKLAPHVPRMRESLAGILGIDVDRISVKATTTDHLGFAGRKEGIAVIAVVLLE